MKANCCLLILAAILAPTLCSAGPLNPQAFASSGVLNLSTGTFTVDTSGAAPVLLDSMGNVLATGSLYKQGGLSYSAGVFNPSVAVLDFNSVVIGSGATVNVQGPNPLAFLSRTSMTISGTINARGGDGQALAGGLGNAGGANGGDGAGGPHPGYAGYGPGGGPSNVFGD